MFVSPNPLIKHQCPVCECYFKGTGVLSCNGFGAITYSDGFTRGPMLPDEKYVLKCPKCNNYFLYKDFISIPIHISLALKNNNFDNEIIGLVDDDYIRHYDYSSWEKVIEHGVFIPKDSSTDEIKDIELNLFKHLWRAYNRKKDEIDNIKYKNVCEKILELINPKDDKDFLTKAEVLRNLEKYQESLDTLEMITEKERFSKFISTISNACKNKISETLVCN